jgi:hypothetical protein
VRAFAKASLAGSTFGVGRLVGTFAVAVLAIFAVGVGSASAATATVTMGSVSAVGGDHVHVTGTIDPGNEEEAFYEFQTSTDGVTWPEFFALPIEGPIAPGSGPTTVEKDLTGLHGGTEYFVRLVAVNSPGGVETVSPGPDPSFTTLPVAAPSVLSISDASAVAYTTADVSGEVERPAGGESAFDVNCRFEVISDAQFVENEANSVPGFANAAQVPCNVDPLTVAGPTPVTAEITGLSVGTEYHLRLVGENAGGTDSKTANNFTTLTPSPPVVTISAPGAVTGTTAHFSGTINPGGTDPVFATTWEFVCEPTPGCPGAGASGTISSPDASPHSVEFDPSGLEPNTAYIVKLVATNAVGGSTESAAQPFHTSAAGPTVETLPAFALANGTEALVGGNVNPKNSPTTYWVEYGATSNYGQSSPATKDAPAGSGGAAETLTQTISGLTPGTTYHFRLVATNGIGGEIHGEDMTFETTPPAPSKRCPNETLRAENNSTALPDCRAYEQVSPTDKNGYDVGIGNRVGTTIAKPTLVAAEDGEAVSFESFGAFANPVGASTINSYLSKRGTTGWTTQALSPPISPAPNSNFPFFFYYTSNLGSAVVQTPPGAGLSSGATDGAANLYLRNNLTNTYATLDLVDPGAESPKSVGTEFIFIGASQNADHVYFESSVALTSNAPVGAKNLYDWHDGHLNLVAIEPGSETPFPEGGTAIQATEAATHAISEDGSRIVFRSFPEGRLYVREDDQRTVEVSPPSIATAKFWGASHQTSQIFFTGSAGGSSNLYRFDTDNRVLTNLTANPASGRVNVAGVAAVSEDGSSVYFRAEGELLAGQGAPGQSNLYLWHEIDGHATITLVATQSDEPILATNANATTYRLTANDRYLTFASSNRLTSYDNTDAVTGEPDTEVYVYDSESGRLTCVSCNLGGEPPRASSTFPEPPVRALRNQQPGASEGGTVFFDSSEALVPDDINDQQDVYEWRQGRVFLISSGRASGSSYYATAGRNGKNVFFVTREELVPSDKDEALDVYDADEEGGFPTPPSSALCEEANTCRGTQNAAPTLPDPATNSASAIGQASPRELRRKAAVRKRKSALRACKKKPTKFRARCRANVKKRFKKNGGAA